MFRDFTVGAGLALPAFAVDASLRICRRSYAGLRCRPLRAKGKAGGEIERVQAGIKLAREALRSVRRSILTTACV